MASGGLGASGEGMGGILPAKGAAGGKTGAFWLTVDKPGGGGGGGGKTPAAAALGNAATAKLPGVCGKLDISKDSPIGDAETPPTLGGSGTAAGDTFTPSAKNPPSLPVSSIVWGNVNF